MDTAKVKMLFAAIECGSLSRAAQDFSYTPSAFSHMLASFEQSLGVRILERSAKGVTLTPEGEMLLPKFKRLLAAHTRLPFCGWGNRPPSDALARLQAGFFRPSRPASYILPFWTRLFCFWG